MTIPCHTHQADDASLPGLIRDILSRRGITGGQLQDFLHPRLADLPSPFLMQDMEQAVTLVLQARERGSRIVVYGDYDVDGTCAAVLLVNFFRQHMEMSAEIHQPHRLRQGYGLHPDDLRQLARSAGPHPLLVTVDCGISAVAEVALARELGFAVLVTDHHELPTILPAADAILNPRRQDCFFPDKDIAGVGVAFFLLMALRTRLAQAGCFAAQGMPNLKKELELVALGTVADVVPLTGVNRILVKGGVEVMAGRPRAGVAALLKKARMDDGVIGGRDIAFRLAPRLNAASRMGKVELARDLLGTDNDSEAWRIADQLETVNSERQELTAQILAAALEQSRRSAGEHSSSRTVWGPWHPGVVGIVAARLAEEHNCPAVVLCEDNTLLKGSVRSARGVNIHHALEQCRDLLLRFGGHAAAGGLTLEASKAAAFAERFDLAVRAQIQYAEDKEKISTEDDISLAGLLGAELVQPGFLQHYLFLEPFGCGNPEPIFVLDGVQPTSVRVFGRTRQHLGFSFLWHGVRVDGIAFNMAHWAPRMTDGSVVTLRCTVRQQNFAGQERTLAFHVKDINLAV